MNTPFREIDHGGDIGIEARGSDLAGLLENATKGLLGLICRGSVGQDVERSIRVSSSSAEDLLVDWLCEVISLAGVYGEVYGAVRIDSAGEWHARGVLLGEKADPSKHELRFDVKAATYHRLAVERREGGYYGRVIFDL
jgi:SHS2 domain-containing protein